ncbi:TIGR00288 family NYN domain-containing protein [uncultured Methanolobus sp.]|uniref:TIGR00288 family NYN domain-containing protein n=1 Tax=uncultured Methanolobus sp. TaxID=218300 RepID=UPI002AAA8667|nr:TIGR00288 family NYN domain-containing protein [uncultured Methanolobus sp.]
MANVKTGLNSIVKYLSTKKETGRRSIGLLVDGPNVLRKEFNVNLEEIRDVLKEYGNVKIGRVFLNQYASDKLVEAIENNGFEPIICSSDVDVRLAVEGMELVYNPTIDTMALVTRDADFKPLLNKANEHGKETIIFGVEPGFSTALRNSADYVIILENDEMNYYDDSDDEGGDTEFSTNSDVGNPHRKKGALIDY